MTLKNDSYTNHANNSKRDRRTGFATVVFISLIELIEF